MPWTPLFGPPGHVRTPLFGAVGRRASPSLDVAVSSPGPHPRPRLWNSEGRCVKGGQEILGNVNHEAETLGCELGCEALGVARREAPRKIWALV